MLIMAKAAPLLLVHIWKVTDPHLVYPSCPSLPPPPLLSFLPLFKHPFHVSLILLLIFPSMWINKGVIEYY